MAVANGTGALAFSARKKDPHKAVFFAVSVHSAKALPYGGHIEWYGVGTSFDEIVVFCPAYAPFGKGCLPRYSVLRKSFILACISAGAENNTGFRNLRVCYGSDSSAAGHGIQACCLLYSVPRRLLR